MFKNTSPKILAQKMEDVSFFILKWGSPIWNGNCNSLFFALIKKLMNGTFSEKIWQRRHYCLVQFPRKNHPKMLWNQWKYWDIIFNSKSSSTAGVFLFWIVTLCHFHTKLFRNTDDTQCSLQKIWIWYYNQPKDFG